MKKKRKIGEVFRTLKEVKNIDNRKVVSLITEKNLGPISDLLFSRFGNVLIIMDNV